MDRVTSIMTFVKVVDTGGFATAARALDLSPSVVTNHVQALEERLGVRLLNRTTRKVNLTEVGQAYYERCVRILAELEEADHLAEALQLKPRGALRLNTSPAIPQIIAPVIASYVAQYPEVSVEIASTARMVDIVEEGFDLAIRAHPMPDSSLIVRRLASYHMVVCGAPDYFARRGTPERPQDLANHNCMYFGYAAWETHEWRFTHGDGDQAVSISGNLKVNNVDSLRLAAVLGQGLIYLPSFMLADEFESGRLVSVLTQFAAPEMPINAIYPHRQFVPSKVRSFIDLATREFRDASWNRNESISADR
jgi:DNA-binding transcriptional LysR family regulator